MKLYHYPKCSTCKKAIKWLDDHNIIYEKIHIVEFHWTVEYITELYEKSKKPIEKFFNTSGLVYRELDLKNKLKNMTLEEKITLLTTNGMLLKRPILYDGDVIIIGFKENEYMEELKYLL